MTDVEALAVDRLREVAMSRFGLHDVKGGGWYARNGLNRAAGRGREYANAAMATLGIRLVRELD
jgi:formylglycine-generating enzyme required for sulfatase activity